MADYVSNVANGSTFDALMTKINDLNPSAITELEAQVDALDDQVDTLETRLVDYNPNVLLWEGSCTSGSITIPSDIRKYKMFIVHQNAAGADIPVAFSNADNYFSGSAGYVSTTSPNLLYMYQAGFYVTAYSTTSTTLSFYASNYWVINYSNNDINKSSTVAVTQIWGVL